LPVAIPTNPSHISKILMRVDLSNVDIELYIGLNFNATARSLADSYWPAFGALLDSNGPSPADGVMMAMAALNGVSTTTSSLLLKTMCVHRPFCSVAVLQVRF
jgi:hypothetical protein